MNPRIRNNLIVARPASVECEMFRWSMMFVVAGLIVSVGCRERSTAPDERDREAPAVEAVDGAEDQPADAARDQRDVGLVAWLDPVKLGMTRAELMGMLKLDEPEIPEFALLNSGTIAPSIEVVLASGIPATVILDSEDRVCCIRAASDQVRFHGSIGVGSTYAEVKQAHPNARMVRWMGYGFLVQIDRFTWVVFPHDSETRSGILVDEVRVGHIEARNDL